MAKNWTFGLDLDFFGKWFEFWTFLEMVQRIWSFFGKLSKNSPNFGLQYKYSLTFFKVLVRLDLVIKIEPLLLYSPAPPAALF